MKLRGEGSGEVSGRGVSVAGTGPGALWENVGWAGRA
jgi:hypothetical protein